MNMCQWMTLKEMLNGEWMMVNVCLKCSYFMQDGYCERLGVHCGVNSPICEFYVKRRKNGSNNKNNG